MIYLLTVNYNCTPLIEKLIDSLNEGLGLDTRLLIVNNSPEDGEISTLESTGVKILEAKTNLGFGKACNIGLRYIYEKEPTGIVWLINPDAYLLPDSLEKARQFFRENPEVSIVGTEIYEPDGKIWFGWGKFNPKIGTINVVEESLDYGDKPYLIPDWVTGCSLLMNLKKFPECPYFDPEYFLYYEDFEISRRYGGLGHIVGVTNRIKVIHEPSSVTSRYGYLKLTHNIYSYLLSLEKYTALTILVYRFIRMLFVSLITLPFKPKFASAKIKGLFMYINRIISPANVENYPRLDTHQG